ncbi:CHAP domain-containing protein [Rhodococcus sp. ARC_M6]|uniref:CHAP domain-containing protein n=1 Tax=Rhodococcus sp. ARC_M6 TaxID=2928852 RepID=UPI001FB1C36B|nr:CHAP domain-containing protein [Rhodococcus sp. ARC_M6]MCJ0902504.1 CHAP domain-containing protein [Rhodococcus sp. ARC_M6]
MPLEQNPTRSKLVGLVGFCVVLALLLAGGLWYFNRHGDALAGEKLNSFPTVSHNELSSAQSELVTSLEQEWKSGDPGTKYAEGVEESWCSDFVSWNMNQIGAPFSNPNSGSWRIPGVYTLQEYYESVGSFVPYGQDYQPKVGDTILYSGDSPYGQHVNIVLVNDAGTLTTIGGNENNSVMIHRIDPAEVAGIVGFGTF